MRTREPRLPIPRGARERVVERNKDGTKSRSEYRRGRKVVAVMLWHPDGGPAWGWMMRDGVHHGLSIEWHENGRVAFVEPWVDGFAHGIVRHYDDRGVLRAKMKFVRGTGVDVWCQGPMIDEVRLERGSPTLIRYWGNEQRLFRETPYRDNVEHGIVREWNDRGRLRRGYPQYFVTGKRVDKRAYLRRAREDTTLPPYRVRDDSPRRTLPAEYIRR